VVIWRTGVGMATGLSRQHTGAGRDLYHVSREYVRWKSGSRSAHPLSPIRVLPECYVALKCGVAHTLDRVPIMRHRTPPVLPEPACVVPSF